jgi:hypothetical protein
LQHICLHGLFIIEETSDWTRYISAEDLTAILRARGAKVQSSPNSKTTHILHGLLDREDRRTMVWQESKRRTLYLEQCEARRGLAGLSGPPSLIHDYLAFITNNGLKAAVDTKTNMARFRADPENPRRVPPPPGRERGRGRIMSATLVYSAQGGQQRHQGSEDLLMITKQFESIAFILSNGLA